MSDMPDIRNGRITIRLPIELLAKIRNGAAEHKMDVTEYARYVLANQLDKVPLTSADLAWIQEQMDKNQRKRNGN